MHVLAGMPMLTFTEIGKLRVEALSFFLLLFFLSAAAVMWIWNLLRRDFVRLPRLSYLKALGIVTLWGMAFGLVLTMISGARELLTPGAWEKDGLTYRLATSRESRQQRQALEAEIQSQRHMRMHALKGALWEYAKAHDGSFPPNDRDPAIPSGFWETADPSRARFVYIAGRKAGVGSEVVAYEPTNVFPGPRVLLSDGIIRSGNDSEIQAARRAASALAAEART
jgi:hypothetical protein